MTYGTVSIKSLSLQLVRLHASFNQLDAATGADGHVQVANCVHLAQESCGWLGEVLA